MRLPPRICVLSALLLFMTFAFAAADELPIPAQWTLTEAVRFALANSPDSTAALERIAAAEAELSLARATFLPRLELGAEYSRTDNPMYSFGNILNHGTFANDIDFNDPGMTDNLQAKATLQYRLYNGGRDQAGIEAASFREEAAKQEQRAVMSRLGFEAVRAFYTIVQAEDTLKARSAAVEAIDSSFLVAKARYDEGDLLREDLLNLEVQQSKARENLIRARHGLSLARQGFLNLLGLSGTEVSLDPVGNQQRMTPDRRDAGLRPELQAMAMVIKAHEAGLRQAKGGALPTADAFGSYQLDKGTEPEDGDGASWVAGLRLNYALFDGHQADAATRRAAARLAEARAQQRKLELGLKFEVDQATLALQQEEERLLVTERMVASATESARLARARFKEGVVLASDLIDTENRLTDSLVSHALAKAAREIAVADLRRAVGLPQNETAAP